MDGSVVDAVFAAHYARLGGGALQGGEFDSDDDLDDLDELIGACVAEEFAAAYASHAFELKVGEAVATGDDVNVKPKPWKWVQYAIKMRGVVKKVYKAIKAEADAVQEDKSAYDVNNPPDLRGRWRNAYMNVRGGGGGEAPLSADDREAKAEYDKMKRFMEKNGLSLGKEVMDYRAFKESLRDGLIETKGMDMKDTLLTLAKNAIDKFKKARSIKDE